MSKREERTDSEVLVSIDSYLRKIHGWVSFYGLAGLLYGGAAFAFGFLMAGGL